MSSHVLSRNTHTASSRAGEGKVLADRIVGGGYTFKGALVLAVRALVVTQGAASLKVVTKILALHCVVTSFRAFDFLIVALLFRVSLSITQVSLPVTSLHRFGAFHLETPQSSLVKVIWSCCEAFTINGALANTFKALPTEQVPTTGLHWVRDQLQTDGTLQVFQGL